MTPGSAVEQVSAARHLINFATPPGQVLSDYFQFTVTFSPKSHSNITPFAGFSLVCFLLQD